MNAHVDRLIYTIGHSNKSFESFQALLSEHEIDVVADVRSSPYSRYAVHFSAEPLKAALQNAGFKYVYLGKQLGGMPKDRSLYDEHGHVRYDLIAQSEAFKAGIARLLTGVKEYRIALMCGEENPAHCHRRNLIAPALAALGLQVMHIRGNGELQSEDDLRKLNREEPGAPDVVQLSLFR